MICFAAIALAACRGDVTTVQARGTVSGLVGSGLVLQNNGKEDVPVFADGEFVFAPVQWGTPYHVTIKSQPNTPTQVCTVSNGSGLVAYKMAAISVNCVTPAFVVGGTISGLTGNPVWLQNNGGDDLLAATDGAFAFPTPLLDGARYAVTIRTQTDAPRQTCTVSDGSGVVDNSNVTSVNITCVTRVERTIGGVATGLLSALVLNNGADDLLVSGNGSFSFPNTVLEGESYSVSIKTYPGAPVQSCVVTHGAGIVGQSDVTDISVNCAPPVPVPTYALGGTVSGLQGTGLVLRDAVSGGTLNVTANGSFSFGPRLVSGTEYALTVQTQPAGPAQSCTLSNGSGTIGAADVDNIAVICPPPPHFAFVTSLSRTDVFSVDTATGALTATGDSVSQGGIFGGTVALDRFLYLSDVVGNSVRGYAIDYLSGELVEVAGSPFATGGSQPQAMGRSADGRFLYVANRASNTISVFSIDGSTGVLTPVGLPVATGTYPLSVSATPDGKFLYVANYIGGSVSAYAIDSVGGTLALLAEIPTAVNSRFLAVDVNSKFLYVTTGGNVVYGYGINASSGALTSVPASPFTAGTTAQNIAIDPLGKFLYVTNETSATVIGYTIDPVTGALTQTGSPLPTGGLPEGVTVDPNGKFVYVASQSANSVAVFEVDPATGSLWASGASPTGVVPIGVAVLNPQ